jgi:hypothetical protein
MQRWIIAAAVAAGVWGCAEAPCALAEPAGRPLFSRATQENEQVVQDVRDALTAFVGRNKHWPTDLGELTAFAEAEGVTLDLGVFQKTAYRVESKDGASIAVFEFAMKGSPAKGAFAIARTVIE